MVSAPSPVTVLTRSLEDAAVRGPKQFACSDVAQVYAMFFQPAGVKTTGTQTLDYCVVLWLESCTGWLVYLNGDFAYRVFPHEAADVPSFLRDMRNNRLEMGALAVARYRAKL